MKYEQDKIFLRHLEYNIVEHCNLRCAGCDHSSPIMPKKFVPLETFQKDLADLGSAAHIGMLKLIGGEPTMHPRIVDFIKGAKELQIADKIGVITNGTLLHRMPKEFWENINSLKVSLYPGVKMKITTEEIQYLSEKHGFSLTLADQDVFRHTTLDQKIEDEKLVEEIFEACELPTVHACHTLRNGKLYKCSPAAFAEDRLERINIKIESQNDSVSINNNPDLKKDIRTYMSENIPLTACQYCLGTSGKDFGHHQLPANHKLSSKINSIINPSDLVDPDKLKPILPRSRNSELEHGI